MTPPVFSQRHRALSYANGKRQNLMRFVKWWWESATKRIGQNIFGRSPSTFYTYLRFMHSWWRHFPFFSCYFAFSLFFHVETHTQWQDERKKMSVKARSKKKIETHHLCRRRLHRWCCVIVVFSRKIRFFFLRFSCRFTHFDLTGWNISKD